MTIRIKTQKDHFQTEFAVDLPTDVSEVDELLKGTKTTGKMVVLYNDGGIVGINVEQKTKVLAPQSTQIKEILGVSEKIL